MAKSTLVPFELPTDFSRDPLTEMTQKGAQELLRTAVLAEVSSFFASHADLHDEHGRQRLVRHGFLLEHEMMTGIDAVPVQVPRVRDNGANADGSNIKCRYALAPPYLHKAIVGRGAAALAVSQGELLSDFSDTLATLMGPDAEGLSSSTITRINAAWWEQYNAGAHLI